MTIGDKVIIPNAMGHELAVCSVTFDRQPPTSATSLTYLPIVAFEVQVDGSFAPLLVSGKIIGWGEIRASVSGAWVYGVCGSDRVAVTTADARYGSMEEFVAHARVLVALKVEEVRQQKGWSQDQLPMTLIHADQNGEVLAARE